MKLKRWDLQEAPFTSTTLISDEDKKGEKDGDIVAMISYSDQGNIVVLFKDGYNIDELLVTGEKLVFETMRARRVKVYRATVISPPDYSSLIYCGSSKSKSEQQPETVTQPRSQG